MRAISVRSSSQGLGTRPPSELALARCRHLAGTDHYLSSEPDRSSHYYFTMVSSLSMLPTCVLVLLTTFLVLRRLLPLFSQAISKHLKIRTISFRSIRGIEWNNNLSSGSKSVLAVKVER